MDDDIAAHLFWSGEKDKYKYEANRIKGYRNKFNMNLRVSENTGERPKTKQQPKEINGTLVYHRR